MFCLQSSCLALMFVSLALLGALYSILVFYLLGSGVLLIILAVILVTIGCGLFLVRGVMTCQSPVRLSLTSILLVTSTIARRLPQPLGTSVTNCLSGVRGARRLSPALSLNQMAFHWIAETDFDNIVGKTNQCKQKIPSLFISELSRDLVRVSRR